MKLTEKKQSNFTPHPETDGPIKAVIVDITDVKKRNTAYGEKEEFRIVYESEMVDEEKDRRHCIWSRGYTPSLNEKANLRKDLKKIMGRDLTAAESKEFDMEALIGHGVKIIVQHEHKDERTFANISFIAPDKDKPLKPSGKFVRQRDRDNEDKPALVEATGWESVVVHVGKYKGKKLGEVDEAGVTTLIEKWLPKAEAEGKDEDAALIAALNEVSSILDNY